MNKKRFFATMLVIALVLSSVQVPTIQAKSKVPRTAKNMTILVGQRKTIKVTGVKIKKKIFKLTSKRDKKIISVSRKGVVQGKKVGSAKVKITATYQANKRLKKKTLYVVVKVKPKKVSVNPVASATPAVNAVEIVTEKPQEPTTTPSPAPTTEATTEPTKVPSPVPTATPFEYKKDGILVKDGTLLNYQGEATVLTVPEGVTAIGDNALKESTIREIVLPNTLESIGMKSFQGCTNLKKIDCTDTVERVDDYAFEGCSALEYVSIPNKDAEIGESILDGCTSLSSAYIPAAQSDCTHNYMAVSFDASCTAKGKNLSICKDCGNIVDVEVPALGHDAEVVVTEATCTNPGKKQTVCKRCEVLLNVDIVQAKGHTPGKPEVIQEPTCEEDGISVARCTSCNEILKRESIPASGHTDGDFITEKEATCTESGLKVKHCTTCNQRLNDTEETIKKIPHSFGLWIPVFNPTCILPGTQRRICSVCGETETTDIDSIGHHWNEAKYTWSDDGSICKAERICQNDICHVETEEAVIMSHVETPATCVETGTTEYVALFKNPAFQQQIKRIKDIQPIGHDWGITSYVWSDDGSTCSAKRICKNDASHVESEDAEITSRVKVEPDCTNKGTTEYTATFKNDAFERQAKDVADISAVGHRWKTATYSWSADGSSCIATRVCENDSNHIETEEAVITSSVKNEATCTEKGTTTYTATFENDAFTTQSKDVVDISATGHSWGTVSYSWSGDGKSCTAKRICENDSNHVETENANITNRVKTEATCLTDGTTEYIATFENNAFATQTKDVVDIPATGHNYGEISYVWSDDGKSCIATRVCEKDSNHVETESGTITNEVKTTPTCTEKGVTTYTSTFHNSAFVTQTKNITDIPATGHQWQTPSYIWSKDGKSCRAVMVCENDDSHMEHEDAVITSAVQVPASCTEQGTTRYTATFTNDAFENQTKDVVDIPANGHSFGTPTYAWSEDGSECVATRACMTHSAHKEIEEATISSSIKIQPNCTEKGTTTYTATFKNEAFATQTKDVVDIPAIGHDWKDAVYSWSDSADKCTATRVCNHDSSHVESEEVASTNSVKINPTCEEKGTTEYVADFNNEAFDTQIKEVIDIPATGHNWGTVEYTWSSDGKSCVAKRVCNHDSSHIETEDAIISSAVEIPATCTEKGTTKYTASFNHEAFETQTKSIIDIQPKGHNWGTVEYTWSADNRTCTAKRVCGNNSSHIETEVSTVTSNVKSDATCELDGTTTYTAEFENAAFETQAKDVQNISSIGHDWGEVTYEWSADGKSCVASRICNHDSGHVDKENAKITSVVKVDPNCTTRGTTTYTAAFENEAFESQTKDVVDIDALGHNYDSVVVPPTCLNNGYTSHTCSRCNHNYISDITLATGHNWEKATYVWSADGKSCKATRVCKTDSSHKEIESAAITSETCVPATCTEKGTTTYTAEFQNDAFITQTKDVIDIEATGHNWNAPVYTWSDDGKSCIATRVCENNTNHIETEEAVITDKIKTAATCTEKGTTTYTATFSNSAFATQTKDIVDIPATGHSPHDGYCTVCNEKIAGLYDEDGSLLCTWEDSGIDVETNYTYNTYNSSTTSPYYIIKYDCPITRKVVIPDGVTTIGDWAFGYCVGLTSIIIPSSVTSIGVYAFYGCSNLTNITIPDSVTSIGDYAFQNCTGLTSITIPDGVTSIGDYAFQDCTGLTSITIPDSVTSIGDYAFKGCTGLTSITIPDSVTSIGIRAFYGCSGLTNITIPDGVTSIGSKTFQGCTGLTSITIPDSVTSIGRYAFADCTGLTSITIPNSVTSIGKQAFYGCRGLTSVTFKSTTGWYVGDSAGAKTTAMSSSDLANTSTAATYLKSTYCSKHWTQTTE